MKWRINKFEYMECIKKKMPNYCENELLVSGPETEIERFWNENRMSAEEARQIYEEDEARDLSFMKSVPVKNETCNEQTEAWGTKWDACDPHGDKSDTEIRYYFNTAWSPPEEWLQKVAVKYPKLDFDMESKEPGCDFYINLIYKHGFRKLKKMMTYEEYLEMKYDVKDRFWRMQQEIAENEEILDILMKIYSKNHEYSDFEEFYDNNPSDIVTDEMRDILEIDEAPDVKYSIFRLVDHFFEENHEKEKDEIIQILKSA